MQNKSIKRLVYSLLCLCTTPIYGHDFWIEPNQFFTQADQRVEFTLREGVDFKGDTLPYITDWFRDFSITNHQGRRSIESEIGNDPAAILTPFNGSSLLGYFSTQNYVSLKPEKFNHYLKEEGMDYIIPLREKRGDAHLKAKEYFVRCAKTLINQGPDDHRIYNTELNYPLEIIALNDPYSLTAGETFRFQLNHNGKPIRGIRLRAIRQGHPQQHIDATTDVAGHGAITLPHPGVWMIKAVHMVALKGDPKADWESYWASFLFEIR